jgi:hypothetical protein
MARVTLRTELKYSFEGLAKAGIVHTGRDVSLDPPAPPEDCDSVTVTISFYPAGTKAINDIDLGGIKGPVDGEDPDADPPAGGEGYEVSAVEWSNDGAGFDFTGPFKMGETYWARVKITPLDGYKFGNLDDLANRVSHGGGGATVKPANDGKDSIYIIMSLRAVS